MDAFEIVRRRAAAQRQKAALAPDCRGLQVARRLAQAEGYDPIPLDVDDPLLQGAEAVLDRGVEAIFYRGSAEEEEAATLIAHELGHLSLHDGLSWCHSRDLAGEIEGPAEAEPSLETSAGAEEELVEPGGAIHRLDAYGARERQELQANVFARELLLPRPMARDLFLESHLGARQMAERLGLPLELVRQQLCDALLLPPYLDEDKEDSVGASDLTLDASQRAAAHHLGSPLLLEAGPGTGKTRTLVARVLFLMEQGVDPASMLVLTFSNKAAQEIVDRVGRFWNDATPTLFAGTFHAFGLEILRKYHDQLGLTPDLKVIDRADAIALLEEQLPALQLVHHQNLYEPALELKEILAAISRAKDELVDAAGYERLVSAMAERAATDAERLAAEKALEVARVYAAYEASLEKRGWVDFGDLVMKPTLLLERDPAVRTAMRLRYRQVLVDEYQDVNRAGARLLKALADDGRRLWVVGDSRQSIYRFRGASSANMRLFDRDFPGAERMALATSYRSTNEIVSTVQGFARSMKASEGMIPLELEAYRGSRAGGEPVLIEAEDGDDEVSALAGRIQELFVSGVPLEEQAVLCRSNAQLERLALGLQERGLPILHLGSLFERSEIRDLLSILSFVIDPRGGALARLAKMPEYAIPAADVRVFLDAVAGVDAENGDRLDALSLSRSLAGLPVEDGRKAPSESLLGDLNDKLSDPGRSGLIRLAQDLEPSLPKHSPWNLLATYLFDSSEVLRRPPSESMLEGQMRDVAIFQCLGFIKSARAGGRGFPAKRLLDRIRRLVLLNEERDLRQMPAAALHLQAVRLMTFHGSKGLELEAVHLPGLFRGGFPSSYRPPRCPPPDGLMTRVGEPKDGEKELHEAEEECLFFVACSRAKSFLTLYRPTKNRDRRRNPSAFLERVESSIVRLDEPARLPSGPAGSVGSLPLEGRELLHQTRARDLNVYERCPRRFFYARIFRLPGYRRDGAYQDTHGCLYDLLDWMRANPEQVEVRETRDRLEAVWKKSGPVGHAFEAQYKVLLSGLVDQLVEAKQELSPLETDESGHALSLTLGDCRVDLEPDLAGINQAGLTVLRLVRTGRQGSFKAEGVGHALWQQAAQERFGSSARVEVVHLADGGRSPVALTAQKLRNRLDKGRDLVEGIARGHFPAKTDPLTCPRCPYFFVCPTVPGGPISLRDFGLERGGSSGDRRTAAETGGSDSSEKSLRSELPVGSTESD